MSFSENRECAAEVRTDVSPVSDHGGGEAEVETETDVSQVRDRDGGKEENDPSKTCTDVDYFLGISP